MTAKARFFWLSLLVRLSFVNEPAVCCCFEAWRYARRSTACNSGKELAPSKGILTVSGRRAQLRQSAFRKCTGVDLSLLDLGLVSSSISDGCSAASSLSSGAGSSSSSLVLLSRMQQHHATVAAIKSGRISNDAMPTANGTVEAAASSLAETASEAGILPTASERHTDRDSCERCARLLSV